MAFTSENALQGSRRFCFVLDAYGSGFAGNADATRYVFGNSSTGMALGAPWRLVKLASTADVTAESADATMTITAYNGTVGAGARAMETTLTLTAVAAVSAETDTVTNSGKDSFSATDKLTVRAVLDYTADAVTIGDFKIYVFGEWAI